MNDEKDFSSLHRELLQTWDGGQVILDWMNNELDSKYASNERPIILFLPGLVGKKYFPNLG